MGIEIKKEVFPSGLRLVTENITDFPTVSLGLWLNVGSRDETHSQNGLAHFIEHLFFKGTHRRTAIEIAKELDRLGGYSNAFTSKEYTCLHGKVLPEDLPRFLDILADIFLNPLFSPEDIEREKQIILQEIKMLEDSPEELVHELFSSLLWGEHPLARPILGEWEVISRVSSEDVISFYKKHYKASNLVIAAAGKVEHEELLTLVQNYFDKLIAGEPQKRTSPKPFSTCGVQHRNLEQVHLALGMATPGTKDERRYGLLFLNTLLGGNMSSRLFQEVREKRGLAYAIYSYLSLYEDVGQLGIYVAVEKEKLKETLLVIKDELNSLMEDKISTEEFEAAFDNLKSALLLSADSPDSRMTRLARNEFIFGRYIPYEETVQKIKTLTPQDITTLAREVFAVKPTLALLGPISEEEGLSLYQELFEEK
ncbi:M16 family metallopeptidase [Thermodesulfatator autotrophicus]|uniref:Peptidase M16 n=1 Tax=Thermodesulfatator autotrophicus TaxID=1795632 RepID=A0A177E9H3_9BACT|nr:pitrilysin family protein [Thermodesulfatator autotrophicus]OAG28458.1 hypothetical protein TH606_01780 [Thermodesulfatator autotrophicus]